MHQELPIEGAPLNTLKIIPCTPRFSQADRSTPNTTRINFSRERILATPSLADRTGRATTSRELKPFWIESSLREEKRKKASLDVGIPPDFCLDLHGDKILIASRFENEVKPILPLLKSVSNTKKKLTFSPQLRPLDPKLLHKDNFFMILKSKLNDEMDAREMNNGSPLRTSKSGQLLKGSPNLTSRNKVNMRPNIRELRQSLNIKTARQADCLNVEAQDVGYVDIYNSNPNPWPSVTRSRGNSISHECSPAQTPGTNNIYKMQVQKKKPSLSQLKLDLNLHKKVMGAGSVVVDRYVPILKIRGGLQNSIVQ